MCDLLKYHVTVIGTSQFAYGILFMVYAVLVICHFFRVSHY